MAYWLMFSPLLRGGCGFGHAGVLFSTPQRGQLNSCDMQPLLAEVRIIAGSKRQVYLQFLVKNLTSQGQ